MDAASFDFFYDLGSPYSYLAATQLRRISERTGARSRLYPITLGGVRKVTGHQMPPAQQLAYMGQDTARWAQRYGVAMQMPIPPKPSASPKSAGPRSTSPSPTPHD